MRLLLYIQKRRASTQSRLTCAMISNVRMLHAKGFEYDREASLEFNVGSGSVVRLEQLKFTAEKQP